MLIHDQIEHERVFDSRFGRGAIPPDYALHPEAKPLMKLSPSQVKVIDRGEWPARIRDKARLQNRVSDVRRTSGPGGGKIPSLNQGSVGYCWAHSSTMAHMLIRALMGLEYVKLSAFMVAAIIKKGRDEGGWGALSLDFIEKNGQCTDAEWHEGSRNLALDTPETRAVAARHKVTGDWADLTRDEWDRSMTDDVVGTLLLSDTPVVADLNWWSHSVVLMDLVDGAAERDNARDEVSGKRLDFRRFEVVYGMNDPVTQGFGKKGLNSWGDDWGDEGEFTLTGQKAICDGAVAATVAMAA